MRRATLLIHRGALGLRAARLEQRRVIVVGSSATIRGANPTRALASLLDKAQSCLAPAETLRGCESINDAAKSLEDVRSLDAVAEQDATLLTRDAVGGDDRSTRGAGRDRTFLENLVFSGASGAALDSAPEEEPESPPYRNPDEVRALRKLRKEEEEQHDDDKLGGFHSAQKKKRDEAALDAAQEEEKKMDGAAVTFDGDESFFVDQTTEDASPFADARPLNADRVSGQFNDMGLTESEQGASEPVTMLEPEVSTPHPLGDDVRDQLDRGDYSRFFGRGAKHDKDPLTGSRFKNDVLEGFFAGGRALPSRSDFEKAGGNPVCYTLLVAAQKRIAKKQLKAANAATRANGPYFGLDRFPDESEGGYVIQSVWCSLEGGGNSTSWQQACEVFYENYPHKRPQGLPTTRTTTRTTRDDSERKSTEPYDPTVAVAPVLYESNTNRLSGTGLHNRDEHNPQHVFVHGHYGRVVQEQDQLVEVEEAKALLDAHAKEYVLVAKSQELIADMVFLTPRGVGPANPMPNFSRIATMGATKKNKLRAAGTKLLYEFETADGDWKDRLDEIYVEKVEDGTLMFMPSAIVNLVKLEVKFGFLERDPVTQKVDKPGWRAQKLQKLMDDAKHGQTGAKNKISPSHLGLFLIHYAMQYGLMDWDRCVLEACVHGVGGTTNVLAALSDLDRERALKGCGAHSAGARISFDLDETQAVNGLMGRALQEWSEVVMDRAQNGQRTPFTLQYYAATSLGADEEGLHPQVWTINDAPAVALECLTASGSGSWTPLMLGSQLFQALQHGPRLLLNRPHLKLDDFIGSILFRCFLNRKLATNEEGYWWTIWYGLDYRLTYEHPTKGKITICPLTMRKQLLQERAAWRASHGA